MPPLSLAFHFQCTLMYIPPHIDVYTQGQRYSHTQIERHSLIHTYTTCTHTLTHTQQITAPHDSRNYSDGKIQEFKDRVEELKREHKRFVTKVQTLDPSYNGTTPWQPRGYTRKRSHDNRPKSHDQAKEPSRKKLCSPLIEKEEKEKKDLLETNLAKKALKSPNLLGLQYSDSESSSEET